VIAEVQEQELGLILNEPVRLQHLVMI
jgi:hypothetical protein